MKYFLSLAAFFILSTSLLCPMKGSLDGMGGSAPTDDNAIAFRQRLKQIPGGCCISPNRGVVLFKDTDDNVQLKFEANPPFKEFFHKGDSIIMQRTNEEPVSLVQISKPIIDCIGASIDGSKLIFVSHEYKKYNGYSHGADPELYVYDVKHDIARLLYEPIDVRAILGVKPEHYMHKLEAIAISPDAQKIAFIHEIADEGARAYGSVRNQYRVTIYQCSTGALAHWDLWQVPEKGDGISYTFISFLFNEDATKLGLYYKESDFSTWVSPYEGFNGGPQWGVSEHPEYKTQILSL